MTLLNISPSRILGRFFPLPLPPDLSFEGQTVVVTGGTSGLGLATATKFYNLGANVIISCRNIAKGEEVRSKILAQSMNTTSSKATVMLAELDMSTYASCVNFVDGLKQKLDNRAPDVVVLSAGSINPKFELSPEGWEKTIQVNALSTALLGLLLVNWMKADSINRTSLAHLVFVTSRDHLYADVSKWPEIAADDGILHHLSDPKDWPAWWVDDQPNYASSKMMAMYAFDKICKLALDSDEEPLVIVKSVCPGTVKTNIGRGIAAASFVLKIMTPIYLWVLGKTSDHGARHCVNAAIKPKSEHGKFTIAWLTDEQYQKKAIFNRTSANGRKVQALVWKEMMDDFESKIPIFAKKNE